MKTINELYSVYLSDVAVELRVGENLRIEETRFICSQTNYRNILEFAVNLAKYKQLPFQNHVHPEHQS